MEKAGAVQASVFFIGIFPDGHRPRTVFPAGGAEPALWPAGQAACTPLFSLRLSVRDAMAALVVLRRRSGRGLMISCRKLSAQAQAGAPLLCAGGADSPRGACVRAHRAKEISFALLSFSPFSVRAHTLRCRGSNIFL